MARETKGFRRMPCTSTCSSAASTRNPLAPTTEKRKKAGSNLASCADQAASSRAQARSPISTQRSGGVSRHRLQACALTSAMGSSMAAAGSSQMTLA